MMYIINTHMRNDKIKLAVVLKWNNLCINALLCCKIVFLDERVVLSPFLRKQFFTLYYF